MATSNKSIEAILGLGNPSEEYKNTYHNVGRLFVEAISKQSFKIPQKKSFAYAKEDQLVLVRPLTFMNESGGATKEALLYFKIKPEHLVVAHDDSDMTLGTWKLSFDQRSAGHKGIDSIIHTLGTQKFWRLKIGIRPANERTRKKAEEFVLKKISKKDAKTLEDVFSQIIQEGFTKQS